MTEDFERIVDCHRRASEMGLSVCISGFGDGWNNHAGEYPRKGKPGIAYEQTDIVETLLYFDKKGSLVGIFKYFPNDILKDGLFVENAGDFTVIVHPAQRGCGIGAKLLSAAVERWDINFKQQSYTLPGAELVMHFLQRGLAKK